jgi:hypothetical protein
MNAQEEDRRSRRLAKAARFPLELCVIAAVGLFTYGRALVDCSSSTSDSASTSTAASTGGAASAVAGGSP